MEPSVSYLMSNDKAELKKTVEVILPECKSTILPQVAKLDEDIICSGVNLSEDNEFGETKAAKTDKS